MFQNLNKCCFRINSTVLILLITVDGGWSDWSDTSECSVTCGEGEKTQSRLCNNPAPANGGAECEESPTQTVGCSQDPCPSKSFLIPSMYHFSNHAKVK